MLFTLLPWLLAGALAASSASAQQLDQNFDDWGVYSLRQKGEDGKSRLVCYAAAIPAQAAANHQAPAARAPFILVASRAGKDEFNGASGVDYKPGSDATLEIDTASFKLFTAENRAWAYNEGQDAAIAAALRKGGYATLKGIGPDGREISHTYPLKGFASAYQRMKQLCNK